MRLLKLKLHPCVSETDIKTPIHDINFSLLDVQVMRKGKERKGKESVWSVFMHSELWRKLVIGLSTKVAMLPLPLKNVEKRVAVNGKCASAKCCTSETDWRDIKDYERRRMDCKRGIFRLKMKLEFIRHHESTSQ